MFTPDTTIQPREFLQTPPSVREYVSAPGGRHGRGAEVELKFDQWLLPYFGAQSIDACASEIKSAVGRLSNLEPGWDGEDAPAFANEVISSASHIATRIAAGTSLWPGDPVAPVVSPVADGSIDLLWQVKQRQLLLNVAGHPGLSLTYAAQDADGSRFRGRLGGVSSQVAHLAAWIQGNPWTA